jgi:hypothetical protein
VASRFSLGGIYLRGLTQRTERTKPAVEAALEYSFGHVVVNNVSRFRVKFN